MNQSRIFAEAPLDLDTQVPWPAINRMSDATIAEMAIGRLALMMLGRPAFITLPECTYRVIRVEFSDDPGDRAAVKSPDLVVKVTVTHSHLGTRHLIWMRMGAVLRLKREPNAHGVNYEMNTEFRNAYDYAIHDHHPQPNRLEGTAAQGDDYDAV